MYDVLTSRYRFACPHRGASEVSLSGFRTLERLPGAAHPVVYQVRFACPCGEEHDGLVSHDELDWAPLGLDGGVVFLNLMTAHVEPISAELAEHAASRIRAGEWPWSFFCYPEERPRPVFSHEHVDVPFHNDREVGVLEHVFEGDVHAVLEEFRAELWSGGFDARRLEL
jgi:hypothetical protein